MSTPRHDDPAAAINQVLSEVIDAILDVKQAHRRVPETQALHAVLDQLFDDLRTWARLLAPAGLDEIRLVSGRGSGGPSVPRPAAPAAAAATRGRAA